MTFSLLNYWGFLFCCEKLFVGFPEFTNSVIEWSRDHFVRWIRFYSPRKAGNTLAPPSGKDCTKPGCWLLSSSLQMEIHVYIDH